MEDVFDLNMEEMSESLPGNNIAKFCRKLSRNIEQIYKNGKTNINEEISSKQQDKIITYGIYTYLINKFLSEQMYEESECIFKNFFIVEEIILCLSIVYFNFLKENKQIYETYSSYCETFSRQFIIEVNNIFVNKTKLKNYFNS